MKIDRLGAHLQAFAEMIQQRKTLQLCARYGTGAISKLPAEMVQMIEDFLIDSERERAQAAWTSELRCYEDMCDEIDHFSMDELDQAHEMYHDADPKCECSEMYPYVKDISSDLEAAEEVCGFMDDSLSDLGIARHNTRSRLWEDKIIKRPSFFSQQEELLATYFGINVWVSQGCHCYLGEALDRSLGTPVAYLTLPAASTQHKCWEKIIPNRDESRRDASMPPSTPPTQSSLERFPRAMRLLDLVPYDLRSPLSTETPDGEDVNSADEAAKAKDVNSVDVASRAPTWTPQLTLLQRLKAQKCVSREGVWKWQDS